MKPEERAAPIDSRLDLTQYDHCFWLGDMNYRLSAELMPPAESGVPMSASERREHVMQLINDKKWSTLLQYDELLDEVRMGRVLHGFRMVIPSFRPTFKVARHTDGTEEDLSVYYNEKRLPAYCDRILWHSLPGLSENVAPAP